jgi:hypothetical protein
MQPQIALFVILGSAKGKICHLFLFSLCINALEHFLLEKNAVGLESVTNHKNNDQ